MITINEDSKRIGDLFIVTKHRSDFLNEKITEIFIKLTNRITKNPGIIVVKGHILKQALELVENIQEAGYVCMIVGMNIVTMDNILTSRGFTKQYL